VPFPVDHENKKNLVANKCLKISQRGKKHTWWPQGCLQLMKRKKRLGGHQVPKGSRIKKKITWWSLGAICIQDAKRKHLVPTN
jgi:hypothetical protein